MFLSKACTVLSVHLSVCLSACLPLPLTHTPCLLHGRLQVALTGSSRALHGHLARAHSLTQERAPLCLLSLVGDGSGQGSDRPSPAIGGVSWTCPGHSSILPHRCLHFLDRGNPISTRSLAVHAFSWSFSLLCFCSFFLIGTVVLLIS